MVEKREEDSRDGAGGVEGAEGWGTPGEDGMQNRQDSQNATAEAHEPQVAGSPSGSEVGMRDAEGRRLPGFDGDAIEPAEEGENRGERDQVDSVSQKA